MDRHKTLSPYPLRMEPHMRKELDDEAERNGRSLHGEILQRLKESLKKPERSLERMC